MKKKLILTGCAGFIGSNFVKKIACSDGVREKYDFIIVDSLTYAGRKQTLQPELDAFEHLQFFKIDIRDAGAIKELFQQSTPDGVIHFAAESHVDRSIENPNIFVETNVLGTLNLLNASLACAQKNTDFRFVHVSTDEVYGTLSESDPAFTENTPLAANSPYSASKAGSDLMVRAFYETYKLHTTITRCSNNYGPHQFPEKLIPLMIQNALQDKPLPVYGNGQNIRDWIYVDDHNRGIWMTYLNGKAGEVYNFGGNSEKRNLDVVHQLLKTLKKPDSLIRFVEDRKGHDWRYAIDYTKATKELGWKPEVSFNEGLQKTVNWYLENTSWLEMVAKTK